MSLAWSTVVVLWLLSPGLAASIGFYAPLKFSRDIAPQGVLPQLALAVGISFPVHWFLIAMLHWLNSSVGWSLQIDFAAVLDMVQPGQAGADDGLAAKLQDNYHRIGAYYVLSVVLGYLVGLALGSLLSRGWFRGVVAHGWALRLGYAEKGKATIFAHVLTNVRHGKLVLMYRGALRGFYIGPDGRISYVALLNAKRYFMRLEGNAPTVTDPKLQLRLVDDLPEAAVEQPVATPAPADGLTEGGEIRPLLIIEGEDIANVAFVRRTWSMDARRQREVIRKFREAEKQSKATSRDAVRTQAH